MHEGAGRHPALGVWPVPDLVEAATRAGHPERAHERFADFEIWAAHCGRPGIDALAHRCRAMLAAAGTDPAEIVDEHFQNALKRHEEAERSGQAQPFDHARSQLVYGEWLRRARHRARARHQLSEALTVLDRLDASCWADRAASELRATGQTVRKRDVGAAGRLTPQELQVIRLAARGNTNREIAAQLFLSPRTVAFHLYNAYPKLGVASRAELSRLDLDSLMS
jgi:DNA-binding CsgD family transcriptional regulator